MFRIVRMFCTLKLRMSIYFFLTLNFVNEIITKPTFNLLFCKFESIENVAEPRRNVPPFPPTWSGLHVH